MANKKLLALVAVASAGYGARRLARRSGVNDQDLVAHFPGDDVIPQAYYIADRATVVSGRPDEVWPWIVQLGKQRAGWYSPRWLEKLLVWDKSKWGARTPLAQYQSLAIGDRVPDWGPGELEVLGIEQNQYLLYGSVKPGDAKGTYLFSWVHVLEPVGTDKCRVYTRLRIRSSGHRVLDALSSVMGLFDWGTMVVMYAGLRHNIDETKQLDK